MIISLLFLIWNYKFKISYTFKKGWIKLGEILGKFIAPIVMGFIYFVVITPIGILLRLFGKDLLNIKFNKNKSYWIKRAKDINTMKRQF